MDNNNSNLDTKKLYLEFPFLYTSTARVVAVENADSEQPGVVLDQTIFHAQGGGQKGDRGTINGEVVTSAKHTPSGGVLHTLAGPTAMVVGQEVNLAIDRHWRTINANLHTGGHLIAAVGESLFPGLRAVSGHHWEGEARVEFSGDDRPDIDAFKEALETKLGEDVMSGLPIRVIGEPYTERSIQIGGYEPVPCGGTHAESTARLGKIEIDRVRVKSKRLRVSYTVQGSD